MNDWIYVKNCGIICKTFSLKFLYTMVRTTSVMLLLAIHGEEVLTWIWKTCAPSLRWTHADLVFAKMLIRLQELMVQIFLRSQNLPSSIATFENFALTSLRSSLFPLFPRATLRTSKLPFDITFCPGNLRSTTSTENSFSRHVACSRAILFLTKLRHVSRRVLFA